MKLFEDELARLIVTHWDEGLNALLDALDGAIIRIELGDEPLSPLCKFIFWPLDFLKRGAYLVK